MPGARTPAVPDRDCSLCPRLAAFRQENRARFPDWHNAPVPSFGSIDAPALIVGLAPGLRGANRTGRPFTGDYAGTLLYQTLLDHGLAAGTYGDGAPDDLSLVDCRVSNAVRCVPPENRPTTAERRTCNAFLAEEIAAMRTLRVVLALGSIAHSAVLTALGGRQADSPFAHAAVHPRAAPDGDGPIVVDSYHCSRLNTNTGRLTPAMFAAVISEVAALAKD